MLILTRKSGESINIGSDIVVRVLEIKGNQARIGIQAPRHITVHREEIFQQVKQSNELAARRSPSSLGDVRKLWIQKAKKTEPVEEPGAGGEQS